jgi:hypothetical protein
LVIYVDEST